jgi:hypothetical protein
MVSYINTIYSTPSLLSRILDTSHWATPWPLCILYLSDIVLSQNSIKYMRLSVFRIIAYLFKLSHFFGRHHSMSLRFFHSIIRFLQNEFAIDTYSWLLNKVTIIDELTVRMGTYNIKVCFKDFLNFCLLWFLLDRVLDLTKVKGKLTALT